ncbi:MAG: aspartate dehydrogenase [Paracoccaceae bacterium]|jgi:aspartate dehydrogenase
MRLQHLGLIGAGSIVQELLAVLDRSLPSPLTRITILVRPGRAEAARVALSGHSRAATHLEIIEDPAGFATQPPDLVIEAAGHSAVAAYVPDLLRQGIETVIASTGTLSDAALYQALTQAAIDGDTRLVLPAGAVGAMDILAALAPADIRQVTYTSRKPPMAWQGTKAEDQLTLTTLTQEAIFFDGDAGTAAADYPKNANVAATIALAGIGFDRTRVQMIADPSVSANIHSFTVTSDAAELQVRIEGKPSPRNPKTSLPTVYSLVREVMRRVLPIVS